MLVLGGYEWFWIVIGSLFLGGLIGPIYNCLISVLPSRKPFLSTFICQKCDKEINLRLLYFFSYLRKLGPCKYCGLPTAVRLFLVDISSILLIGISFFIFGVSIQGVQFFLFYSALIIVWFTDMETRLIPNKVTYTMVIVGFSFALYRDYFLDALIGCVLNFMVYMFIYLVSKWYYKREAVGGGDIKLSAAIGAFWGWKFGALALYISFILGGVIGILLIALKIRSKGDYIPFAPILVMGSIVTMLWQDKLIYFLRFYK